MSSILLFIFRRDFRLTDNTAFLACQKYALENNCQLLPLFVFNAEQINPKNNAYYSNNSVQFLIESLRDLEKSLLSLRYLTTNDEPTTLKKVIRSLDGECKGVFFNRDITPYARRRDENLEVELSKLNVPVFAYEDYTLLPIETILTKTGKPYEVFTFFYKTGLKFKVPEPVEAVEKVKYYKDKRRLPDEQSEPIEVYYKPNPNLNVHGGRKLALEILRRIRNKEFAEYDKTRDNPSLHGTGTTLLSAYLKYGCLSVREVYHAVREAHSVNHGLIRELFWREFYYTVAWYFPKVLRGQISSAKNEGMVSKYSTVKWDTNRSALTAWMNGTTGVPLVDAGMRQLNTTGYMHNRLRMIVASFLTKDLHIHWLEGERYFANKLIDYDPCQNSGGWQWSAGVGLDSHPYLRIFSPWRQAERFDPETDYIKKWVPELEKVSTYDILKWDNPKVRARYQIDYPAPMVDHATEVKETKRRFIKY
jgi:deoxyribodipyrimidine photo-lyase